MFSVAGGSPKRAIRSVLPVSRVDDIDRFGSNRISKNRIGNIFARDQSHADSPALLIFPLENRVEEELLKCKWARKLKSKREDHI